MRIFSQLYIFSQPPFFSLKLGLIGYAEVWKIPSNLLLLELEETKVILLTCRTNAREPNLQAPRQRDQREPAED